MTDNVQHFVYSTTERPYKQDHEGPYVIPQSLKGPNGNKLVWKDMNLLDSSDLSKVYTFLEEHTQFGNVTPKTTIHLTFSKSFLRWAMCDAPRQPSKGYTFALQETETGDICAFAGGTAMPYNLPTDRTSGRTECRVCTYCILCCVHTKIRGFRIAGLMKDEALRRSRLYGHTNTALATAATNLRFPLAAHFKFMSRPLTPTWLHAIGFLDNDVIDTIMGRTNAKATCTQHEIHNALDNYFFVPPRPVLKGWRQMGLEDTDAVLDCLVKGYEQSVYVPAWTREDVAHWFLPSSHKPVYTYVRYETSRTLLTDIISFYVLDKQVRDYAEPTDKAPYSVKTVREAFLHYPVCFRGQAHVHLPKQASHNSARARTKHWQKWFDDILHFAKQAAHADIVYMHPGNVLCPALVPSETKAKEILRHKRCLHCSMELNTYLHKWDTVSMTQDIDKTKLGFSPL